jgi:CdiI immunity protein
VTDEVIVDGARVKLLSRGQTVDVRRRDALDRVYFVRAGSDIFLSAMDVEFHVFKFSDKLWVLPWESVGVEEAIGAIWPEKRERSARCWEAVLDEMPRDWRKSYLWGLVRPHTPALSVLPPSDLPKWQAKRESSKGSYFGEHEYPFLDALIGGWFHADWDIEGDTLEAVIASYKKVYVSEDWAETRADIGRLLGRYDDRMLPQEFIHLFHPGVEGWRGKSLRQWLAPIDELLR